MNKTEYLKYKLLSEKPLKDFLVWMKENKHGCYVAGGALTSIATGNHDKIEDYDIYFKDRKSCVEAIRYMKELDPHVSFISDKSITYCINSDLKIQFIYYDFYPEAQDIFKHFDFSINMAAYDNIKEDVIYHENFWMHNSQRYLTINTKTKFPILTLLRLDKYKGRGYKTSRSEVIKLGLTISQLNIDSWEEFSSQVGNSYGFDLADLKDLESEEFSLDKALDRIVDVRVGGDIPMQEQYKYPIKVVDFVVADEPIEFVYINNDKYYLSPEAGDASDEISTLVEEGVLSEEEVDSKEYLSGKWYTLIDESEYKKDETLKASWGSRSLYSKEEIPLGYHTGKILVEVGFEEGSITDFCNGVVEVNNFVMKDIICRGSDVKTFTDGGDVAYKKIATGMYGSYDFKGHAFDLNGPFIRGEFNAIKGLRLDHLKKHVVINGGASKYAHNTFSGYITEGGEDITAKEVLLLADSFNLCFGGSCSINNGKFSGRYNTD